MSTTTVAPTTTLAPPPIAEPTATSTTALQASGDVALPAQKTSSSGDDLNPALVVLAIALAAGAAGGTFWVRRRAAQPSG